MSRGVVTVSRLMSLGFALPSVSTVAVPVVQVLVVGTRISTRHSAVSLIRTACDKHLRGGGTDEISVAELLQEKVDEQADKAKENAKEKIEEKLELDGKLNELAERAEDELERIRDATLGTRKL